MVNTNELRQGYEMIDHSRINTQSSFLCVSWECVGITTCLVYCENDGDWDFVPIDLQENWSTEAFNQAVKRANELREKLSLKKPVLEVCF